MVGNDELEDLYAAGSIGMNTYLVTDWMLPCPDHPHTGARGTFEELLEFLAAL